MSRNFRITQDFVLASGGAKTKARNNLAAIALLKQIEAEDRTASSDEQMVLAQYVGWGGISQVFNPTPDRDWQDLASQVKEILEPAEYSSAFESVLNAHYTSYAVIREIYEGLDHLGFNGGRILEPSMGVGNYLGVMPPEMERRSEVTGIELDSITGRLAQKLYPDHQIYVQGFEKSLLPKDYFDLALSNVPFGDYKIGDPEYNDLNLKVHDYFFAKSLDRVRPGGLVCFITSTGTMQSKSGKGFRVWMAERANLVGAMRLPGDAFKSNAGTEVTTDLIILQKLGPTVRPSNEQWIDVVGVGINDAEGNELTTNEYYARHPERMLGIPCDDKLYPGRLALQGEGNTLERMREAFAAFPSQVYSPNNAINPLTGEAARLPVSEEGLPRTFIPAEYQSSLKNFGYLAYEDKLWQRQGDWLEQTAITGRTAERIKGMLEIRDAVHEVFDVQVKGGTDAQLAQTQQKLNQVYDRFVSKQGYLSDTANARAFRVDPDAQLLLALEIKNDETQEVKKADVFSRRTVRPRVIKESAETPQEALLTSLNEYGRVVPGYMAQLLSRPEAEVINELQTQSLIYLEPISKLWQTQDEYLSGEVREKLKEAKTAVEADGQFQANVAALEAVQPRDLGPGEIEVRLGAPWVPTETIAAFANDLLELDPAENLIKVEHSVKLAVWAVSASKQTANNALNTSTYGTPKLTALELIEATLNLRDAAVYYKDPDGVMKLDQEATLSSRMKQQQVQEKFKGWLWQDFDRAEKLCRIYNDQFNGKVIREFKNPNLEMPGSSPSIAMRAHQKDGTWRALLSDATLLAHVVGAGKTFTIVAAALEMRRLGIAQKSMIVVPNHMLGQFVRELYQLYPNARVLAPSENETKASKRRELMARIATGDWDAVVVTHSAFTRLPISEDQKIQFHQAELDSLDTLMGDSDVKQGNAIVKQLARERKKLQERIDRITQSKIKDNGVTFEQLGVDALFVDEAHFWKNLGRISKLQNIAGLSNTNSLRAQDAFMKCRIIQGNGGKLVFATGTPVSNSIAELYTMQRFLQPDALKRQGIENFDAWVGAFAEKVTAPEIDPTGRFKLKTRLTRFCNVPELMTLFREVGDIKTAEQLDLPRPQVDRLTIATGASPLQLKYMERLIERAELVAGRKVDPRDDNMLWVTTDGRRAALDPRLISQDLPDFPESKVNQAIANIEAIWSATTENSLTQVVFCDLGTPKKTKGDEPAPFSIYQHVKDGLIARGIPADEIAFIHDAPKSKDKENLYAAVREGRIRVLIGSTEKCGVGMNVQERLIAEHHLDPPWRPSDIEQREGRILRQGNRNSKVLILTYVTQGRDGQLGFDSYSWQTLARKAQMVAQVMNGDTTVRSVDDVSSSALSFDEIKAIATGNPLIIEKATVDSRVTELSRYQQSFLNERYSLQRQVSHYLPNDIAAYKERIQQLSEDIERKEDTRGDLFHIRIGAREFGKREDAGMVLQNIMAKVAIEKKEGSQEIGAFAGFQLVVTKDWHNEPGLKLRSPSGLTYTANSADSAFGVARSLEFCISKLDEQLAYAQESLARSESNLVTMSKGLEGTFEYGLELESLLVRQQEINTELGLNKNDEQLVDEGTEETEKVEPQAPEAKETPESVPDSETGEEAEAEPLLDLDAIVSADAKWDWLTDGQVDWDMDIRCSPSAELLEAIENLDLASFKVPEQDNSLLETLPEEPLFEPVDPPKSSLSPPEEVRPFPTFSEGTTAQLEMLYQGEPPTPATSQTEQSKEAPAAQPEEVAAAPPTDIRQPDEISVPPEPAEAIAPPDPAPTVIAPVETLEAPAALDETIAQLTQAVATPEPAAALAQEAIAETRARAIAPISEHRGIAAQTVAVLLHEGGLAERILEGDGFHLRVENEPYNPLVIERHNDQLYLTHYQTQNDEILLDAEMVFQVSADGKLTLTETATQDPIQGGEQRTHSESFARTFAENLLRQGFDDALFQQTQDPSVQPEAEPEPIAQTDTEATLERDKTLPEAQEAPVNEPPPAIAPEPQTQITDPVSTTSAPPTSTVTLDQVESWSRVAKALSKPDDYQARVAQVIADYCAGKPLPEKAEAALNQALAQYQQTLNSVKEWYRISKQQGAPQNYLERIQNVGEGFKQGQPIPEGAIKAMQQDFRLSQWNQLKQGVSEATPERNTARIALRALQQGKDPDEILKILEFDPSYRSIQAHQGHEPALTYSRNALDFAMNVYQNVQPSLSQRRPEPSESRGMSR